MAEVVSFNMVVKLINKADRLQKTGGPKHEISIDLFDVEVELERSTSPPHIEHIRAAVANPQFNSDRPISGLPRTGVS